MKIGLSYSRCVRDIVLGVVDIKDVLVIIGRTNFNPKILEEWEDIWTYYTSRHIEWGDLLIYKNDVRQVSITLWEQGKFHQPRKYGSHSHRRPEIWLETVLPNSELENNPAAKKAWDDFQIIAGLTSVTLDKEYQ
jgi:hypothetical protein